MNRAMPDLFLCLVVLVGAIVLCVGAYLFGRHEESNANQARQLQEERIAAATLAQQNAKATANERQMVRVLNSREAQYLKEETDAKERNARLVAELRSRATRLSVPVVAPSCDAGASRDTAAAGQLGTEARAELVPQAAIDLVNIAGDGDAAVRQLNQVIDAYDDARRACSLELSESGGSTVD